MDSIFGVGVEIHVDARSKRNMTVRLLLFKRYPFSFDSEHPIAHCSSLRSCKKSSSKNIYVQIRMSGNSCSHLPSFFSKFEPHYNPGRPNTNAVGQQKREI
jgi:hypothetical protein